MPIWYYNAERLFRYPVPTNFDFAYIDPSGKVVSQEFFILADDFRNGVAVVKTPIEGLQHAHPEVPINSVFQGESGIVDRNGRVIKGLNFEIKGPFYSDLGVGYFNRPSSVKHSYVHYDLISKNGLRMSDFGWIEAKEFSDGLIAVKGEDEPSEAMSNMWGYRDKDNRQVIKAKFYEAERFSEGLAAVCLKDYEFRDLRDSPGFYHGNRYSYIDKSGSVAIPGPFLEALPFSNGLAAVMDQNGKWGYINKSGAFVVPCEYAWASDYSGKLAAVEKDQMVGFIDGSGKVVIPFKFRDARGFSEGLAPATVDAKKWGFIDESGSFKIAPQFQRAFPFNSERALVYIDPRPPSSQNKAELSHHELSWQKAYRAREDGRINEARALCASIITEAPSSKSAERARRLLKVGLPDHDLSKANNDLYLQGLRLAASGRTAEAEKIYRDLMKKDPGFFAAPGAMGYIFLVEERFDEGIKLLESTVKKFPYYSRGYRRLAELYGETGKFELAQKARQKAIELDPDDH